MEMVLSLVSGTLRLVVSRINSGKGGIASNLKKNKMFVGVLQTKLCSPIKLGPESKLVPKVLTPKNVGGVIFPNNTNVIKNTR